MTETEVQPIINSIYENFASSILLRRRNEYGSTQLAVTSTNPLEVLKTLYPLYNIREFDGYEFFPDVNNHPRGPEIGLEIRKMGKVPGIDVEISELAGLITFKECCRESNPFVKEKGRNISAETRGIIRTLERTYFKRKDVGEIIQTLNQFR